MNWKNKSGIVFAVLFVFLFSSLVSGAFYGPAERLGEMIVKNQVFVAGPTKTVVDPVVIFKKGGFSNRGVEAKVYEMVGKVYVGKGGQLRNFPEKGFVKLESTHLREWAKGVTPKAAVAKIRNLLRKAGQAASRSSAVAKVSKGKNGFLNVGVQGPKGTVNVSLPDSKVGGFSLHNQQGTVTSSRIAGGHQVFINTGEGSKAVSGGGGTTILEEDEVVKVVKKKKKSPVVKKKKKPVVKKKGKTKVNAAKSSKWAKRFGWTALIAYLANEVYYGVKTDVVEGPSSVYKIDSLEKASPTVIFGSGAASATLSSQDSGIQEDAISFAAPGFVSLEDSALIRLESSVLPSGLKNGVITLNAPKNILMAKNYYKEYFSKQGIIGKSTSSISTIAESWQEFVAEMEASNQIENLVEGAEILLWEIDEEGGSELYETSPKMACTKTPRIGGKALTLDCDLSALESLPKGDYRLGILVELSPTIYNWVKVETNDLLKNTVHCNFYQSAGASDDCKFYEEAFPLDEVNLIIAEEKKAILEEYPKYEYLTNIPAAGRDALKDAWSGLKTLAETKQALGFFAPGMSPTGIGGGIMDLLLPKRKDFATDEEWSKAVDDKLAELKGKSRLSVFWDVLRDNILPGVAAIPQVIPINAAFKAVSSNVTHAQIRKNLAQKWDEMENYPLSLRAAVHGLPVFYDFESDGSKISFTESEQDFINFTIEPFFGGKRIEKEEALENILNNITVYNINPESLEEVFPIDGEDEMTKINWLASLVNNGKGSVIPIEKVPIKIEEKNIVLPFYSVGEDVDYEYYNTFAIRGLNDRYGEMFEGFKEYYIYNEGKDYITVFKDSGRNMGVEPDCVRIDFKTGVTIDCKEIPATPSNGDGQYSDQDYPKEFPEFGGMKDLFIDDVLELKTGKEYHCVRDPTPYRIWVCRPTDEMQTMDLVIPLVNLKAGGDKAFIGIGKKPELDTSKNSSVAADNFKEFEWSKVKSGYLFYFKPAKETYNFTIKNWDGTKFEVYACQNKESGGTKCDYVIEAGKHVEKMTWVEPNYEAASLTIQSEEIEVPPATTDIIEACKSCSSVQECLACVDWKFILGVFGN